jgi:glycine dehydrogenase subunit 1
MTLLGEAGLMRLARINHETAMATADALAGIAGVEVLTPRFFNEFAVRLPKPAAEVVEALLDHGVMGGVAFSRLDPLAGMDDVLLVAATETNTDEDIAQFADALQEVLA